MNSKYSPWDWAKYFRMHEAAALIAGVPVSSKKQPNSEELYPGARPVLTRLLESWAIGERYKKGDPVSPSHPVSQTLLVEGVDSEVKLTGILVKRAELCRWIEAMGLPSAYDFREPSRNDHAKHAPMPDVDSASNETTPAPQAVPVAQPEAIDFGMLATPEQLINAFGNFTGMRKDWFDNLTDTPRLLAARKVVGTGGKQHTPPLFCPFEVMQWLIDKKRKKGGKVSAEKAWQLLQGNFEKVYNRHSVGDPR